MEKKIIDIIIEVCGDESLRDNIETIDLLENDILDSLAFITLISRLEEEFNIEIQRIWNDQSNSENEEQACGTNTTWFQIYYINKATQNQTVWCWYQETKINKK